MRVAMFAVVLFAIGCHHHAAAPPPVPAPPHDAPTTKTTTTTKTTSCTANNPPSCPASAPAVNHPCDVVGATCVYDAKCCHTITYVCAKSKHFEADFQSCP